MTATGWGASDLIAEERIRLLRVAFLICGSAATAEDVVQDAFLATNGRWEGLRNPRAYLYRATVNRARDVGRRAAREVVTSALPESAVAPGRLVEEDLVLRDALLGLPEAQRTVIVLRYYGGWTPTAIAKALDTNPVTVRSWLRRGLRQLRTILDPTS